MRQVQGETEEAGTGEGTPLRVRDRFLALALVVAVYFGLLGLAGVLR